MADSDAPNVSKMVPYSYNAKARMKELAGRGEDEQTDLWNECVGMYIVREGDLLTPTHFAGYACDPEFRGNGHKQLTMPACVEGFSALAEKVFYGDPDKEERVANAMMGLSKFHHGDGIYGRESTMRAASKMPGARWAQLYSSGEPDFQRVQVTATSLFTTQSKNERNHKMEAMFKTKARNRLKSLTTDHLLYVCANKRLARKCGSVLFQQPYMQWLEAPAGTETAVPMVRDADTNLLTIKAGFAPKRKAERADGFRTMFKPIGGSYTNVMVEGLVVKKLKTADGTPAVAKFVSDDAYGPDLFVGVGDDLIRQHDTVLVPISQFEFSEEDITNKFGGNKDFLLQGHVTSVQKVTLNIKFVGDSHVSPYPKEGFGQYVMRRQLKAIECSYYGTILMEEWNLNVITKNGWMEGDLLDFAMSSYWLDAALPTTSASCYLLKATGNAVLQVSVWLHAYVYVYA